VDGESGMEWKTTTATRMEGKPSRRKRSRQEAMGEWAPSFMMAHARVLANEVARGAAEMKSPVRRASSSRLKKNER